jgi:ABC-type branched-subunit amino acid transport system substrate-binding protein/small-conductance mechanosensitive channel
MVNLREKFSELTRQQLFLLIISVIVVLSVIFSLIARTVVLQPDADRPYRIVLAAPLSGESQLVGDSLLGGARLFVDQINQTGGLAGHLLQLEALDDKGTVEGALDIAKKVSSDDGVLAVLGHGFTTVSEEVSNTYDQAGVPVLNPLSSLYAKNSSTTFFNLTPSYETQTQFLANYALNVLGKKVVSIVRDSSDKGATLSKNFSDTYEKFKTKTNYEWVLDLSGDSDQQLAEIAAEIKAKVDTGTVFIALEPVNAAKFVKELRDVGGRNALIGLSGLATHAFRSTLADLIFAEPGDSPSYRTAGDYIDSVVLTSPLMFDTAGEHVQNFKNNFIDTENRSPDWVSAHAFEAAELIASEVESIDGLNSLSLKELRSALIEKLNTKPLNASKSTTDPMFDVNHQARRANYIGNYSGTTLVSALTQLQPILEGGNKNYIAEFREGRVLFVNDRFMYKTNVIYTGLQIDEISDINLDDGTVMLDFGMWFRFRGNFDPQDIVFKNNAEDIVLGEPVFNEQQGDMTYRLYRVKGKFFMNFGEKSPPYGQYQAGVSFSHELLNKDNLQYVVDFLGLGLASGKTFEASLNETRALNPNLGWQIDRAWIGQDIKTRSVLGNPKYVGHAGSSPDFSTIEAGIILEKSKFNLKKFVDPDYFVYLAIFGILGGVFAVGMDRKERGGFWNFHSWILRVISWPLLLLAAGSLILDFSAQNLSVYTTEMVALTYSVLWWFIPARLLVIALERFVWIPLETHTGRKIPNVIRGFGSTLIYIFALLGITAFVFGQQLTSLLATSGVLAMIIGLAIQANIANVFSGIVLNLERPFQIGDFIKVDNVFGRVSDITWRTVRIESLDGPVVSLTNGKVSEAKIENHNDVPRGLRMELAFHLSPDIDPARVEEVVNEIVQEADYVIGKGGVKAAHQLIFTGIENVNGNWVASYMLIFKVKNFLAKIQARGDFWQSLRNHLLVHEMPLKPSENSILKAVVSDK